MLGPILVFLGVCAIVAVFMAIAHSFLRAAEQAQEGEAAAGQRDEKRSDSPRAGVTEPKWAH